MLALAHETVPTPWSIARVVALVIPLHDSVDEAPAVMVVGLAVNDPIVGAAAVTVNVTAALVPPAVVIVTVRAPGVACPSIVNTTVSDVLVPAT